MGNSRPRAALIILDGFGLSDKQEGNAVKQAQMPFYENLWNCFPHTQLLTSGKAVGLPEGQMGNSEVGHLNIGAGRVVHQSLSEIDDSISHGLFFENPTFVEQIENLKKRKGSLHLVGLVSHGGVHSSFGHLLALLKFSKRLGLESVYIHALLDGRDTAMKVALKDIEELESEIKKLGIGTIASIAGRFYGMDRDGNWDRTQKFYDAMAFQKAPCFTNSKKAIESAYLKGESDEFLPPCIIRTGKESIPIQKEDLLLFFNFRPDRIRQIVRAFGDTSFKEFPTLTEHPHILTLTEYRRDFSFPILFPPRSLSNTLGEVLASHGLSQLRAAETEKYAHVTFFFNAMREEPYSKEHRILVPSLKIQSYDLAPEMKARELTEKVLQFLADSPPSFLLMNYANPDMVGHSGSMQAAVKALEVLDSCLEILIPSLQREGFDILLTADHGNVERMLTEDNHPSKNHTTFPVPLVFIPHDPSSNPYSVHEGILADLAPTVLDLLNLPKPVEMTGNSLLRSS